MATLDVWTALSARIRGLTSASHLAAELLTARNDSVGVMVDLGKHASAILRDLRAFGSTLDSASDSATAAINRVAEKIGPMLVDTTSSTDMRQIHLRSSLVILAALEVELSYLLRDLNEPIRSRTERAFLHLNRQIMVNEDVRRNGRLRMHKGRLSARSLVLYNC